jgi:hypothetical protein
MDTMDRNRKIEKPSATAPPLVDLDLAGRGPILDNTQSVLLLSRIMRGGQGEPGGTRAMVACEPGQDGNGAAISITSMCAGEPPRLSLTPSSGRLPIRPAIPVNSP